jgi:hypothetical protein
MNCDETLTVSSRVCRVALSGAAHSLWQVNVSQTCSVREIGGDNCVVVKRTAACAYLLTLPFIDFLANGFSDCVAFALLCVV